MILILEELGEQLLRLGDFWHIHGRRGLVRCKLAAVGERVIHRHLLQVLLLDDPIALVLLHFSYDAVLCLCSR